MQCDHLVWIHHLYQYQQLLTSPPPPAITTPPSVVSPRRMRLSPHRGSEHTSLLRPNVCLATVAGSSRLGFSRLLYTESSCLDYRTSAPVIPKMHVVKLLTLCKRDSIELMGVNPASDGDAHNICTNARTISTARSVSACPPVIGAEIVAARH